MTIVLIVVLAWLIVEHYKLKKSVKAVRDYLEQNNKDMAGLCSAAVALDNKVLDDHKKLASVLDKLADIEQREANEKPEIAMIDERLEAHQQSIEQQESEEHQGYQQNSVDQQDEIQQQQESQPYYDAIQRVREGATEGELIQQFGLSRDEAVLLMRLHS